MGRVLKVHLKDTTRIEVPDKICKESDKILLKICTDSAQILGHFLSDLSQAFVRSDKILTEFCQNFVRSDKNSVRILSDLTKILSEFCQILCRKKTAKMRGKTPGLPFRTNGGLTEHLNN